MDDRAHDEAEDGTDEKLRWSLRVVTRMSTPGDSVCKTVVDSLAVVTPRPMLVRFLPVLVQYWQRGVRRV